MPPKETPGGGRGGGRGRGGGGGGGRGGRGGGGGGGTPRGGRTVSQPARGAPPHVSTTTTGTPPVPPLPQSAAPTQTQAPSQYTQRVVDDMFLILSCD